jgi:hypothetical protein
MKANFTQKKVQVKIETVAAMLLLIVLASLTLILITSTGKTYKSITDSGETSQEVRTGLAFIATKLRQAEGPVSVRKSQFGENAIVILQQSGNMAFEDWIFFYKGELREMLIPAGSTNVPTASELISKFDTVSITQNALQINIAVTKKSTQPGDTINRSIILTLRTQDGRVN